MNLNMVQICGRLTRDPEVKTTPNGKQVSSFVVATNYSYKNQAIGEKVEEVEFHNVVAFARTAEVIAQYFSKGDEIYIQGRLKTDKWEDKEGRQHQRTQIIADKFEFGQKSKSNQPMRDGQAPAEPEEEISEEISIENIPF